MVTVEQERVVVGQSEWRVINAGTRKEIRVNASQLGIADSKHIDIYEYSGNWLLNVFRASKLRIQTAEFRRMDEDTTGCGGTAKAWIETLGKVEYK